MLQLHTYQYQALDVTMPWRGFVRTSEITE